MTRPLASSPLRAILTRAAPPDLPERKLTRWAADTCGITRAGVHFWLKIQRLKRKSTKLLVAASDGRVTIADFEPFISPRFDSRPKTELHRLLLKASSENGVTHLNVLADRLGIKVCNIYSWVTNNHVPATRARKVVEVSDGAIKLEEILPFVLS